MNKEKEYEVKLTPIVLRELNYLQFEDGVNDRIKATEEILMFLLRLLSEMASDKIEDYKKMSRMICGAQFILETFKALNDEEVLF